MPELQDRISEHMTGGRFFSSIEMAEGEDMIRMVADFLRPDVLMSIEVRFEAVNGALRAQGKAAWTNTLVQGGQEIHLAGFRFEGEPELSSTVRELLSGIRPTMIMAQKAKSSMSARVTGDFSVSPHS